MDDPLLFIGFIVAVAFIQFIYQKERKQMTERVFKMHNDDEIDEYQAAWLIGVPVEEYGPVYREWKNKQ